MPIKLKEAKFGVYHQGCFSSDFQGKYPDIEMKELSNPLTVKKTKNAEYVKISWQVKAPSPKELDEFLSALKKEPRIKELHVFKKVGNFAIILMIFKSPSSTYGVVAKEKSFYISPVVQKGGLEIFDILTTNPKAVARTVDELKDVGEVKVFSIDKFEPDKKPYQLTEKQSQAIKVALEKGYYSWPRNITLEELAQSCGMNRRAFQELLRKAEAKALPQLLKTV